jgi:RNA polymerase sigma factor (sigma-70 family)
MENEPKSCDEAVRVEDHLGLVRAVVCKFYRKGRVEDSELYSVGCIALMKAAASFDPTKSQFSTWAIRLISQRVIDEIYRVSKEQPVADTDHVAKAVSPEARQPVHMVSSIVESRDSDSPSELEGKRVVREYYLNGRSLSDLGRELGMSKEGVRKRVNSAIVALRNKNRRFLEDMQ